MGRGGCEGGSAVLCCGATGMATSGGGIGGLAGGPGVVQRAFQGYGRLCACRPWEVVSGTATLVICVLSMYQHPLLTTTVVDLDPFGEKGEFAGAGVLGMTVLRCASVLYCYRQVRQVGKMGSRYVPAIAAVFAVYCSVLLCSVLVHCLRVDLSDLRDALFVFAFLVDPGRAGVLAQYALAARSAPQVRSRIAAGMGLLGPTLTLDAAVEVLVIGVGTLSGVRKLELLCYFACVSVVIRFLVFLTLFPALLSLFLELSQCHECPTKEQLGNLRKLLSEANANPVVGRLKVIMALGLSLVHVRSRLMGGGKWSIGSALPVGVLMPNPATMEAADHQQLSRMLLRWVSGNAEQLVLGTLFVALVVKSLLGKESEDELHRALLEETSSSLKKEKEEEQEEGEGSVWVLRPCPSVPSVRRQELRVRKADSAPDMSLACFVSRNRSGTPKQQVQHRINDRTKTVSVGVEGGDGGLAPLFQLYTVQYSNWGLTDCPTLLFGNENRLDKSLVTTTSCCSSSSSSSSNNVGQEELKAATTTTRSAASIRPLKYLLQLLEGDDEGPAGLTDAEVLDLVSRGHVVPHQLESALGDFERAVRLRRRIYALKADGGRGKAFARALDMVPYTGYSYERVKDACCENVVGYVGLPVGLVGPLLVDGEPVYVPMATTEGCLVASTSRGAAVIRTAAALAAAAAATAGGGGSEEIAGPDGRAGVSTVVLGDGMTRGPVVRFPSALQAGECQHYLETEAGLHVMQQAFDATSNFAKLRKIQCRVSGRYLFLRFVATTGDAMGMNMVSKGCDKALGVLAAHYPLMEILSLSGNYCADKKSAAVNWVQGRGRSVVCEARIPGSVVAKVLKTDVDSLVELNVAKNLVGSAVAGSIGGFNAHAANIVAAIFIACGQDPAQVVASASCMTLMERYGDEGDLYVSVTMPSLELGTVGGGTVLPAQQACLSLLGVSGASATVPGANAQKLARIVGATVLAGELSLMGALAAGELVRSHLKHNSLIRQQQQQQQQQVRLTHTHLTVWDSRICCIILREQRGEEEEEEEVGKAREQL
ncbi:unnamed protein product [Notodromas monacha]|uniref:3-hydroxy-3-methylglutaryl coenzyme A reductase n=1 Tax=Notodromas monacha TaxID=399045 RepID=A0A7R9G8T6_9CRUS|nr:unnamed protein product [Notodromas monacha]CAG0912438.1 unnamed protein product [Notodromas monacha]